MPVYNRRLFLEACVRGQEVADALRIAADKWAKDGIMHQAYDNQPHIPNPDMINIVGDRAIMVQAYAQLLMLWGEIIANYYVHEPAFFNAANGAFPGQVELKAQLDESIQIIDDIIAANRCVLM